MKDYYTILGLNKDCDNKEIKKAYRQLSMKWHPDKWVNGTDEEKKNAEDKFRECTEAYNVLSNEEKRKNYDNYGDPDGNPNPFGNLNDIFNGFANGFSNGFTSSYNNSLSVRFVTNVKEIYDKLVNNKKIICTYEAKRKCDECNGTGLKKDGKKITCPTCGGRGMMIQREQLRNGLIVERTIICPNCHGKGHIIDKPCDKCHGDGLYMTEVKTELNLPYGIQDNASFVVPNCGNEDKNGNIGDLIILFNIVDDNYAILNNNGDVITRPIDVPILKCIIGGKVEIECPDNKKYFCAIPPGIKDGERVRMKNKGLPNGNGFGNLIIPVNIIMPNKIDEKEKKVIEKLLKSKNFQI